MIQTCNVYLDFLDHLNTVDVPYAVLHGSEALTRGKTSDVDLVLAGEDLPGFEASLHSRYRILTMLNYETTGFGFVLLPKDHDMASAFVVDAATDYRWQGHVFFTDKDLLEGRQRWNGFWVAGPRQEFTYLLVKKIYEKAAVPAHQRRRLELLAHELGPDGEFAILQLFGRTWGERLNNWIAQGQWAEVEAHVAQLRVSLRRQEVCFNQPKYWFPEIRRIWQRWRFPTGLVVAVIGAEQSERVRLIEHLKGAFLGVFRHTAILPGAPRLFTRKRRIGPAGSTCAKPFQSESLSWLRRLFGRLDFTLGFLLKVRPLLVRSTLVLYGGSSENLMASWPGLSFTIFLDGSSRADEGARSADDVLCNYLVERYLSRRHIWFPGPHV